MDDDGLPTGAQQDLLSCLGCICGDGAFEKVCPFSNNDVPAYLEMLDAYEAASEKVDLGPIGVGYVF